MGVTHGAVIDAAWAQTDSVLPMTFDCIVRAAEGHSSDETVVAWLCAEYAQLPGRSWAN
jgi:hypothetical protein